MAAHTVAAAASWSCCDASHGLGRKNERESKANAASALQRLLSAAKESLQTMLVVLILSGRRRLQLHSTWPQQCAGSCGGRWAWEQRVRPTAGGGERASIGARMMREQLTGVARAEERKSWMLKRRAAEAAAAAATADFTARTCRVAGGGSSCTHECVMTSDTVNAAFSIAERKQQQRWSEGAWLSQTQHPHGTLGKGTCSGLASRWQAGFRHPKSSELRLHDRFLVVATARFEPARCKKQQKSSWGLRAAAAQESARLRCREKSMRRLTALLQLKKGGC